MPRPKTRWTNCGVWKKTFRGRKKEQPNKKIKVERKMQSFANRAVFFPGHTVRKKTTFLIPTKKSKLRMACGLEKDVPGSEKREAAKKAFRCASSNLGRKRCYHQRNTGYGCKPRCALCLLGSTHKGNATTAELSRTASRSLLGEETCSCRKRENSGVAAQCLPSSANHFRFRV